MPSHQRCHEHPSSQRRRQQPLSLSTTNILLLGAVSLLATLQSTYAFLPATSTQHLHSNHYPTSSSSRTPSNNNINYLAPLSMIAKSGGRMITTNEQFEQEVLSNKSSLSPDETEYPVLVLFTAPWCGPCRLTNPVVKEVMKQYQNKLTVVEVSTDDLPEVASVAGVLSIPTIQLYHGGKVMDTIVGCVAKNVLARSVDKVLEDLGLLEDEEVEV
mmetsp:Transcript_42/g.102  ORF Transcript_42/g.102 Transcript_42/m.102 type:complete len:215 (+) Transcript_42:148-792(+)